MAEKNEKQKAFEEKVKGMNDEQIKLVLFPSTKGKYTEARLAEIYKDLMTHPASRTQELYSKYIGTPDVHKEIVDRIEAIRVMTLEIGTDMQNVDGLKLAYGTATAAEAIAAIKAL